MEILLLFSLLFNFKPVCLTYVEYIYNLCSVEEEENWVNSHFIVYNLTIHPLMHCKQHNRIKNYSKTE